MSDSNEIITDPRLEKRSRRRFSVSERKRLLAEADALPYGEKGAWLRRNGLYAGQLSTWRKDLAEHGEAGMAARQPGRKPVDPRGKELERLKREKGSPISPAVSTVNTRLWRGVRPSRFLLTGLQQPRALLFSDSDARLQTRSR